jgi:hypothetical protein
MITLKQAMYHLNVGVSPEQLVKEYDLNEDEATELFIQVKSLFEQVIYAAQTNTRRRVWRL